MVDRPVLFLLHGLGCSARTWDPVVEALGDGFDCVALDLPGHGAAAQSDALTVEQMLGWLLDELARRRPATWALVGHSMGGKIATLATARAERGVTGLTRPIALVLVAASPVGPEPMAESTRADMIRWCDEGPVSPAHAAEFVDANTASELPPELLRPAVDDVRRVSRRAWVTWLERGSREDWRDTRVRTPTLVVAGAQDGPLGAAGQRTHVLGHVAASDVVEVQGAAHLIMLEQPDRLATLIATHVGGAAARRSALPTPMVQLLDSDRVSARTRSAMLERVDEPDPQARVLDDAQRRLLTALLARVVPQRGTAIDLAGRIDASLARGVGDGWRFAELPPDQQAWRSGLDTLDAACPDFADLDGPAQDGWVGDLVAGRVGSDQPSLLTPELMALWFEDVRAEAVRTWLSHPAAMARIGYDGFANGGDGVRMQGYLSTSAGEHEPWQLALPDNAGGGAAR